jgi:hypothetical protein
MGAMTTPLDHDVLLESLQEEFRALMEALNGSFHPVNPAAPRRIAELEWRRDDLQRSIRARRHELGMAQSKAVVAAALAAATLAPKAG